MDGVEVVRWLLVASCNLTAKHAEEAEPLWRQRAFPSASLPGFVAWHCARIIDWGVHTVVRNLPELASESEWRETMRYEMGHGAGLSEAEADTIAKTVRSPDVVEYARSLRVRIVDWLGT